MAAELTAAGPACFFADRSCKTGHGHAAATITSVGFEPRLSDQPTWTQHTMMQAVMPGKTRSAGILLAAAATAFLLVASPLSAQRLDNRTAVFAALDKVTARISKLEVPLNETIKFGSLRLTPRVCYSRPATEQPKTSTFVEINETLLSGQDQALFAGWMFAESPGLNAVEHPVFDVWLTECKDPLVPVPQTAASGQAARPSDLGVAPAAAPPRRRAPR